MRAKICGIKTLEDANIAIQAGAWALGFNFYPSSPRYLDESQALRMINVLSHTILKIGVVPATLGQSAASFMQRMGLDLLQVYEDVDVAPSLKQKMILSLNINSMEALPPKDILAQYGFLLLDAPPASDGRVGGTGRLSDWSLAKVLSSSYRLILAGGLTCQNVRHAIQAVRPFAVDVASGVESSIGEKSPTLIKQFINEVNHVT